MADVFISYSHKDADWVRRSLLKNLEDHGFEVLIDYRDFTAGSFGVEEMQRSVERSRHVVLVLTPNYVASDWAKFENVMAQASDPGAVSRKLIPVLRKDCDIPLRLRIIHYRDLRDEDPQQWEFLYRDLLL